MTPRGEDEEQHLGGPKELTSDRSQHHFTRVGHVVHMRVSELELADDKTRVGGQETKASDQNDPPEVRISAWPTVLTAQKSPHPTIPMVARTEGSERIPREIVSAIMTVQL